MLGTELLTGETVDGSETGEESGEMAFRSGVGAIGPRVDIMRRSEGGGSVCVGRLHEAPALEGRDGVRAAGAVPDGLGGPEEATGLRTGLEVEIATVLSAYVGLGLGTAFARRSAYCGLDGREVCVGCLDGLDGVSENFPINCPPGHGIMNSSFFEGFLGAASGPADHELDVGIDSLDGVEGPACLDIETAFF